MDCEKCEKHIKQLRQMYKNLRFQFDRYLDRKEESTRHPLDEMIFKTLAAIRFKVPEPSKDTMEVVESQMKKLRYESIKWALQYDGAAITDADVNSELKDEGHADWVVED